MTAPGRKVPPLLLLCFFLSGATGLVYEVLWTRVLSLTFGHTVWAMTAVLAIFMGGLALGSVLLGRAADRSGDPLRLYGLLELGIGAYCLAGPWLLGLARQGYLDLSPLFSPSFGDTLPLRVLVQALVSAFVLLIPTTLMGGTLPALARGFIREPGEAGRGIAVLYAVNTLGAAAGAFAAGYLLLPAAGIFATNLLAAAVNLGLGGAVLLWRRRGPAWTEAGAVSSPPAAPPPPTIPYEPPPALLVGAAFAATGAAGMAVQIAWVRSLTLVIGSSTYAFSAILVAFLLGIALGGFLYRRIPIPLPAPAAFALFQGATALSTAALLPFFSLLPGLFIRLFAAHPGSYAYTQLVQLAVVGAVVLVPTTLMGMSFPCLAGMAIRRADRVGREVGGLYGANTGGAILGSLAAGFLLIPFAGAQKTLAASVLLYLLTGAAFLAHSRPRARGAVWLAASGLGLVFLAYPPWGASLMSLGPAVYPRQYLEAPEKLEIRNPDSFLFFQEGISSTIAVGRKDEHRYLVVNGKTDASTEGDMETQAKSGLLPLLLHPGPRRVGILGLGSGVTAGVAALFSEVEEIEVVELEPAVVEAAAFFAPVNGGALKDPRLRLHQDDGRSFFEAAGPPFDVIVSVPSNPWIAGVANLFTVDFLHGVKGRLSEGGIFCMWIHTYGMSADTYRLVARTFLQVFPEATLWQSLGGGDTFLIGRSGPDPIVDLAWLKARFARNPRLADGFPWTPLRPLDLFLTSFVLAPRDLRAFAGEGPVNTDDRNLLEFAAPRSIYRLDLEDIPALLAAARRDPWPPFLRDPALDLPGSRLHLGETLLRTGALPFASWEFSRLPSLAPGVPPSGFPLFLRPGESVREGFDGAPRLPLFPAADGFLVEEGESDAAESLEVTLEHLTRTSGVVAREGFGGTAGLALRGLPLFGTAYFVPLQAEAGWEFLVQARVHSGMGPDGIAGVKALSFARAPAGNRQASAGFAGANLLESASLLEVRGKADWETRSFRYSPPPGARAVQLWLYRQGGGARETAAFDDLSLTRIR